MLPLAIFGISNDALNLVVNLLVLFLVVVWVALIYWTYSDARRRIEDPVLVGCATAASLFPFVGTVIYTILRPPEFIEDARERQLEIRAAELRVRQLSVQACPHCDYPIDKTYLRCPSCRRRLRDPCESCGKPLDPRWPICPYCEAEQPGRQPAPPRQQRPAQRQQRPARPAARPKSKPREPRAPASKRVAPSRQAAQRVAREEQREQAGRDAPSGDAPREGRRTAKVRADKTDPPRRPRSADAS